MNMNMNMSFPYIKSELKLEIEQHQHKKRNLTTESESCACELKHEDKKVKKETNEITFLRTTMSTVMIKIETTASHTELFDKIPLGNEVFGDGATIEAVYYKAKAVTVPTEATEATEPAKATKEVDSTEAALEAKPVAAIVSKGELPPQVKCFPSTITLYCKMKDGKRFFKIRWFFSNAVNKIHMASGLDQDTASEYLTSLANYMKDKISCKDISEPIQVLANGMAQAKLGVNLYSLADSLEKAKENDPAVNFVYTPDNHAALKIYTWKKTYGTALVFSTGKILYMGPKGNAELAQLHNKISAMGASWDGVPVILGV